MVLKAQRTVQAPPSSKSETCTLVSTCVLEQILTFPSSRDVLDGVDRKCLLILITNFVFSCSAF